MIHYRFSFIIVAAMFVFVVLANVFIVSRNFAYPYPPAKPSIIPEYAVLDLSGMLLGTRRIAADIAWIQLLQYYGTEEEEDAGKEEEYEVSWELAKFYLGMKNRMAELHHQHNDASGESGYSELLNYCMRVANIDPYFSYMYLYGAGALAWNLDRPDEAIRLLEYGINTMDRYRRPSGTDVHNPFWQLHLYVSAIVYRKTGEFGKMTALLETAVRQPDCPNMVKSVLANIYEKDGKPGRSLRLWLEIYDSGDPTYRARSLEKIEELRKRVGL